MKRIALIIAFLFSVLAIHAQNKFIDILPEMTVIDGELWVLTIDGPSGAAIWKKYKASVMKEYITPYPLPSTPGTDGQGIVFDTGTGAFIYADLTYEQEFQDSLAAIRADLPAAATTNTVHVIATLADTTTIISPVEADIAWVSSDTIAFRDDAQWRVFMGGGTVNTDGTITGDGSVGSPLSVDTSIVASLSALQDTAAAIRGDVVGGLSAVTSDNTLTGNGTSGNPMKVDTSVIASQSALQDSSAAIRADFPSTAGLMSNFTVIGNTGTSETIQEGEELELRGRNGITTSNSPTDIMNIDADTSFLATVNALRDSSAAIRADFPTGGGEITLTGDVTGTGTGTIATTIATGAVGPDELASTTVTPGSYTAPNVTIDSDGRIESATSNPNLINRDELQDTAAAVRADFPTPGGPVEIYDGTTSETMNPGDTLTMVWDEGITGAVGPKTNGQIEVNVKFDGGEATEETAPGNNNTFLMDDGVQNRLEGVTWPNLVGAMRDSLVGGGSGSGSLYILHAEDLYTSSWTTAIQAGIDSLNSLGGGILYIPPGTLELTEAGASSLNPGERFCLQLKSGVHLRLHNNTILKLANGQQVDANGPVNIIEGESIDNASISGGAITGNTAGQTWTGGYGQTTYGCLIKITSASVTNGNSNFYVEDIVLYDHFSNPVVVEGVGFAFINRNIRYSNIETWAVGEGPSITGTVGAIMENIIVHDSTMVMAGDMSELVGCRNFIVDNIVTVAMNGSTAASSIDIGGSSFGRISGIRGYNVVNGISVSDDSGGNPCKNVTIEDCYFQGIRGGGQYGIIISDTTTDSIYINNVSVEDMASGFLVGANGTLSDTSLVVLNNCMAIDNAGTGVYYQSGRLVVNGGDYSGNIDGFTWFGRGYGNSAEIIINNAAFNNNSDYGINIQTSGTGDTTALPNIKAVITASGNAGTGGAINVNVLNTLAFADTTCFIKNTTDNYIATVSNPYATGVNTLVYNNTSNLTTLRGGHHNQVVNVVFEHAVSLVDGSGIETASGSSDSKAVGDIVTLRYDQPAAVWHETSYNAAGSGDNLGNHTATQNIILGTSNWISGDGDNEGVRVGSTGNVGIGTAPSYKLDVLGTTGDIMRIKGTTYEMRIQSGDIFTTNPLMRLGPNPAGAAFQMNNMTENYVIAMEGNKVGIRDNTPSYTLDINATDAIKIPAGTTAQRPGVTGGAMRYNTTTARFEGAFAGQWRPLEHFLEVSTDRIQYAGGTYSYFMSPGELYHTSPTLGIGSNVAGRALYFNVPTANDVITIQGASVGINDNTPDATLDVAGNMRLDGIFYDKDGNAGTDGQILSSTSTATDWIDPATLVGNTQQYAQSHNTGGDNTSISAGTPEQINATTTGTITTIAATSEFTVQADGDLQLTGANNSVVEIKIDLSLTTGGAAQMYYYIAINGTVQATSRIRHDHDGAGYEPVSINWIDIDADTNDVYSVYAEPVTGTEATTISDMRISARKIK